LNSNFIPTIPSGAFNFTFTGQFSGSISLYLGNNQISSIQPGAFRLLKGRVGLFNFDLQGNKLASFPTDVFNIPNITYTISLYFNRLNTITPGTFQGLMPTHNKFALNFFLGNLC
jgi:Leucine-rich repeat (LRR) protein